MPSPRGLSGLSAKTSSSKDLQLATRRQRQTIPMSSAVRTDVESFQLIQGLTSRHLYDDMTMDIDDLESLTTEVSVDEVSSLGAQITDVDFFWAHRLSHSGNF